MARVNTTVTITGDKAVLARLKRTEDGLADLSAPMGTLSKYLTRYYSQAFVSQGGVFDAPWPRLNPHYEVRKFKKYPGRPPLVKRGDMQRGFKADVGARSTVISNTAPYFKYHQSSAPRTKLPRRVMMAINDTVERQIFLIVNQYIRDQLRDA